MSTATGVRRAGAVPPASCGGGLGRLRLAAAAATLLAAPAAGGSVGHYATAPFAEAQGAGRVVLVHFTAMGCALCEAQAKALDRLLQEPPFDSIAAFRADFDVEADVGRAMRASRSALVLYRGRAEVARDSGITAYSDIRDFLRKAFPRQVRGRAGPRPSNRTTPRP